MVHFYSLESGKNEIATRLLYMAVAHMYFKDPAKPEIDNLNYLDFYYGKYEDKLDKYIEKVFEVKALERFKIYYRSKDFGINDFLKSIEGITQKTDLIILDHLHYFDMQSNNEK